MAKNDMQEEGCPMCDKHHRWGGMCGQHHWMHVIIKIFVALFIFWCGVQFGELKSTIRAAYYNSGYGMMNSYGLERGQNYYYGTPSMMGGWTYGTATAVPATTTKAATKK
jgi:hypothetical protein